MKPFEFEITLTDSRVLLTPFSGRKLQVPISQLEKIVVDSPVRSLKSEITLGNLQESPLSRPNFIIYFGGCVFTLL